MLCPQLLLTTAYLQLTKQQALLSLFNGLIVLNETYMSIYKMYMNTFCRLATAAADARVPRAEEARCPPGQQQAVLRHLHPTDVRGPAECWGSCCGQYAGEQGC